MQNSFDVALYFYTDWQPWSFFYTIVKLKFTTFIFFKLS